MDDPLDEIPPSSFDESSWMMVYFYSSSIYIYREREREISLFVVVKTWNEWEAVALK